MEKQWADSMEKRNVRLDIHDNHAEARFPDVRTFIPLIRKARFAAGNRGPEDFSVRRTSPCAETESGKGRRVEGKINSLTVFQKDRKQRRISAEADVSR